MDFFEIVLQQYGPIGAIVAFFLYRDWQRDQRQAQAERETVAFERQTLVNLVERTAATAQENAGIITQLGALIEENGRVLLAASDAIKGCLAKQLKTAM